MSVETARLAAARRALSRAEDAAGLRVRLATPARPTVMADDDATPADGAVPANAVPAAVRRAGSVSGDLLPVPAALAPLFPGEGLRRGSVVQVSRSTSLLLRLAAAAAVEGGWTALTALPDIGLQAAAEAGLPLGRSVVVPRPGPEAAAVVGALVDGFDILVLGPCRALSDRDRRLLTARLRTRGAVLLSTAPWPGSDLVLRAERGQPQGMGHGWGAMAGQEMTVGATGRGTAGAQVRVRIGVKGLEAVLPGETVLTGETVLPGQPDPALRPPLRAVS